jgi:hypothetical protein
VIITDSRGDPQYVSGYTLNSGKGRRKAAIMYNQFPTRRLTATVRKN